MQPFEWISWEAAATLITGLAAVYAAWRIGNRQVEITKAQSEIQSEFLRLEHLKLKADLYDQRLEIFNATRHFIGFIITVWKVPGIDQNDEGHPLALDVYQEFTRARGAAAFLSSPNVLAKVEAIWEAAEDLSHNKALIDSLIDELSDQPLDENDDSVIAARQRRTRLKTAIQRHYADLAKVFSEDLSLTLPTKANPPMETQTLSGRRFGRG